MYQSFEPIKELKPYIECYWFWKTESLEHGEDLIFPDAVPEIIIHKGVKPSIRIGQSPEHIQSTASVIQLVSKCLKLNLLGSLNVIGIRFKPWGLIRFCNHDIEFFTDQFFTVKNIILPELHDITTVISNTDSLEDIVNILNYKFLNVINNESSLDRAIIELNTRVKGRFTCAKDMAAMMNKSSRSFSRLWKNTVRVQIRTYVRIMRFQEALSLLRNGQSLSEIPHLIGYSDQAHMNREIKSLCGFTPIQIRQYLKGETFEQFYYCRPEAPWLFE